MNGPKLHHYVPRFHLKRFADNTGKLWVWDKERDTIFRAAPERMAAQTHFYRLPDLATAGHDPLMLEKQFASLEGDVAQITAHWLDSLRQMKPLCQLRVSGDERALVSEHIATQFLRTADTRDTYGAYLEEIEGEPPMSERDLQAAHAELIWDPAVSQYFTERWAESSWLFARNPTGTPFKTSDNPIAFRSQDNRRWHKVGIDLPGSYAVFPLAPDVILYCYPREEAYEPLRKWDCHTSPVRLDLGMVESENCGQVFMASRFVFACNDDFEKERAFLKTIGTDIYAPKSGASDG